MFVCVCVMKSFYFFFNYFYFQKKKITNGRLSWRTLLAFSYILLPPHHSSVCVCVCARAPSHPKLPKNDVYSGPRWSVRLIVFHTSNPTLSCTTLLYRAGMVRFEVDRWTGDVLRKVRCDTATIKKTDDINLISKQ